MKKFISLVVSVFSPLFVLAQAVDTTATPTLLTLEDALRIALSENASVKVADQEIERTGYARKGTYASLFPQINGSASYQRTIKKQVMYMDGGGFDMSGMIAESLTNYLLPLYAQHPDVPFPTPAAPEPEEQGSSSNEGFSVGRWNTWSAGINASMPLVNAQLWKSLRISDQDVELAVEKARSSRLETVNQVKQAFFACLLAREAFEVYKSAYENALENCNQIQRRYNAQRASELDLTRAKTTLANAIPNVYDAESSVILSLWQLKAVMGISLDEQVDVAGSLGDYAEHMLYDLQESSELSLDAPAGAPGGAARRSDQGPAVCFAAHALAVLQLQHQRDDQRLQVQRVQVVAVFFCRAESLHPDLCGRAAAERRAPGPCAGAGTGCPADQHGTPAQDCHPSVSQTAMKSYTSARSAAETAQKAYDIASKSYDVGRSTLTDLNDAQLALTQSRLGVSQAVYNFVVAKAGLEGTLGADFIDADGHVQLNKTYSNE